MGDYGNLIPLVDSELTLSTTTPQEIVAIIDKLQNKGSAIELPIKIVKYLKNELAYILSKIFCLSIQSGIYPDILKIANIIPVHKSGKKSTVSNYRPISLLPIFNKIFEKILYKRIEQHFCDHNLISNNQFGFRKSRDTQQATLKLVYDVLPTLGTDVKTIGLFLDFSKAFDTVDHTLLINKLHRYGIRGTSLSLIKSYLENRTHHVTIADSKSTTKPIAISVPQGSVLGPLLFNIYTNDLNLLFQNEKLILYADDTSLILSHNDYIQLNVHANLILYRLSDWCKYNKLALNSGKTKWIYFTHCTRGVPTLSIDGVTIERVDEYKYLGFHLDSHLNHKYHIRFLTAKLSRMCYISAFIRKYISHETAKIIFYGLVQSVLSYGLLIYGGTLVHSTSTCKLRKKYDKIVYNLFSLKDESINDINTIYKRNNILSLIDLYKCKSCVALYKILKENYTPFLHEPITFLTRPRPYLTRNRADFCLPFPKTKSVKLNLLYHAISIWNELHVDLKSLPNSKIFEKQLKNLYLASY